jgi:hypothetical protein
VPRAVKFDRYVGIDVLHVVEVDRPVPGPEQVLIQMKAAGINPGEAAIREGAFAKFERAVVFDDDFANGRVVVAEQRHHVFRVRAFGEAGGAPVRTSLTPVGAGLGARVPPASDASRPPLSVKSIVGCHILRIHFPSAFIRLM